MNNLWCTNYSSVRTNTIFTVFLFFSPFYGEEFQGEIPKKFRYLSFYICDKTDKVIQNLFILQWNLSGIFQPFEVGGQA